MLQLLALLLGIAVLIITIGKIRKLPAKQRKWLLIQIGIAVLVISLLLILVTGRIHWLGVVVGTLVPILKTFLVKPPADPAPSVDLDNETQPNSEAQEKKPQSPAMDTKEALGVLGLEGDVNSGEITAQLVTDTHRKLIQKFHPDRGGNDYLAAKINQAKDVLLSALEKR